MTARKFLAAAGAVALSAGLGLGLSLTASASSFGCTLGDGCGTLHTTGTDLGGNSQAWDAKYQNPMEMVIGYPDNPGDSATSFDLVRHQATHVTGFSDTGLTVSPNPASLAFGSGVTGSVTQTGTSFAISLAGLTSGNHYSFTLTGASFWSGPTTATFTASGATFSGSQVVSIAGDSFHPGHYPVTITLTDTTTPAAFSPQTVAFTVHAHAVTSQSAYYTMVLAKNGFWSNDCVTDPGSGKLRMEPCTLGRMLGQRFAIYDASTSQLLTHVNIHAPNSAPWALKNLLSQGFVTANLPVDSSVPQPDSSDSRQLTDHGHNPAAHASEQWTWNT